MQQKKKKKKTCRHKIRTSKTQSGKGKESRQREGDARITRTRRARGRSLANEKRKEEAVLTPFNERLARNNRIAGRGVEKEGFNVLPSLNLNVYRVLGVALRRFDETRVRTRGSFRRLGKKAEKFIGLARPNEAALVASVQRDERRAAPSNRRRRKRRPFDGVEYKVNAPENFARGFDATAFDRFFKASDYVVWALKRAVDDAVSRPKRLVAC